MPDGTIPLGCLYLPLALIGWVLLPFTAVLWIMCATVGWPRREVAPQRNNASAAHGSGGSAGGEKP